MKKVCVITGTRAEYGLLYWLMKEIESNEQLQLQLIVTGAHLSPEFGLTYTMVEEAFKIDKKVETLLSSDTVVGVAKSMGLTVISLTEAYAELQPDILVVLGDRYEILAAVSAALVNKIPVAHISGGEVTEGAYDDAIRHAVTKMSHFHFVSTDTYRKRVIQLGEEPKRVFNVGALGIDNIRRLTLMEKDEFEESIGFTLNKKNLLVTFHPVTLETLNSSEQFQRVLDALDTLSDTHLIFTKANADSDGRVINTMIDIYVAANKHKAVAFSSLGQKRYLSALKHVDAVVGNSSSGITEAPSFKIGTINIGDRQRGRIKAESVIDCTVETDDIIKAVHTIYDETFQMKLLEVKNPYGDGETSRRIVSVLAHESFEGVIKKSFYDIDKR